MRILLTGFNPFGERDTNPSQLIVQRIAASGRPGITAEVLPTEFEASGNRIRALIRQTEPDAVISLGLAAGRSAISPERVAINLDDASIPDNAGDKRDGRLIAADGPAAYWSTLPLDSIRQALQSRNIPVSMSNHAGAYVCNHVFYVARHELEQLGSPARCGFIHVPLISDHPENVTGLPLETMVEAIECVLDIL